MQCDKTITKCGHICKQVCSHDDECSRCGTLVEKEIPDCGHPIIMRCDQEPKRTDCIVQCNKLLSCGHSCTETCAVLDCGPCQTLIEIPLACRHGGTVKVKCSANEKEIWQAKFSCQVKCEAELVCGHKCSNNCMDCLGGYIHGKCSENCDRVLFCGHNCQVRN